MIPPTLPAHGPEVRGFLRAELADSKGGEYWISSVPRITNEQIRALIEAAERGDSIPDMAEAVGVPLRAASAVVRALRHMKPFPGQGELYGRTKGEFGKMRQDR